jgi:histidinol-phosphate aminotransferase
MSRFISSRFRGFKSYTPGEQPHDTEYVKLNTNESPFPPAPKVCTALRQVDMESLRLYPDPQGTALKKKIAALYDVEPENVFLSNGSDDILNFAFLAFNDTDDTLLMPDITYSFYRVIASLHGVHYKEVLLKDDMHIDIGDYCGSGCNIVIPNPNAPTGIALSPAEIEEILKTNPDKVVLVDEAYVDFGAESVVPLIKKYDNLLVSQTFSKSRSFAGGRLGFAIADRELIADLGVIQYSTNPYNVNTLSLILAGAAVDANDYYMDNCRKIAENREYTTEKLLGLGFEVLPSKANFVFARHPKVSGENVYAELKKRGVLVRHFDDERIKDYVRITIGSRDQMDVLLRQLEAIVG